MPASNPLTSGQYTTTATRLLAAPGQHVTFDAAVEHVEGGLKGRNRTDGGKLAKLVQRQVRNAYRSRLALPAQFGKRCGTFGQRRVRVGRVQVKQIDVIGSEPPQAFFAFTDERRGPGVERLLPAGLPMDAGLGGNHHLVAAAGTARPIKCSLSPSMP